MIRSHSSREWHGDEIARRADRANGRALVAINENVVAVAKQRAHVISGTLRRSIHSAPVTYTGIGDDAQARARELPNATVRDVVDGSLLVGSWVAYACVEEIGRRHVFLTPALELVGGALSDKIIQTAYKQEGL